VLLRRELEVEDAQHECADSGVILDGIVEEQLLLGGLRRAQGSVERPEMGTSRRLHECILVQVTIEQRVTHEEQVRILSGPNCL